MATADETTVGGSVFITVSCGGTIGGDRAVPIEKRLFLFFFFFFKEGIYTLFSLLSGARAGGPSPGARRLRRRRRAGTIFSDSIRTAQVFYAFFDSFSFFFVNIYNEIFITSYWNICSDGFRLRYGFFTRFSPLFFKTFILFCCLFYSIKNEHGNKRADQTPKLRKDVKKKGSGRWANPNTRRRRGAAIHDRENINQKKKRKMKRKVCRYLYSIRSGALHLIASSKLTHFLSSKILRFEM